MYSNGSFEPRTVKELYPYQVEAIERISAGLDGLEPGQNLLFQLPTGGGKTVIFSEIAAHYIKVKRHKVLILTHRVELLHQTSRSLSSIGVNNKIIDRKVQELDDQTEYGCFVAMVETLNNRLTENARYLTDIGLVIVDEAHYNAFRKIFQYFDKVTILGVTATPLSSNKNLPLYENYHRLIVGQSISDLIEMGYLARPTTYTYDVNLQSLKVGIDGDFTISSLDYLYSLYHMQDKLVQAYEERSLGKKTLIFNSGIATSKRVFGLFQQKGYPVRHLDSTFSEQERKDTLDWFRANDDAILTSVSILTTGFDEPSVETIMLNRATRSLTLYHQMIGRGSRVLPNKEAFTIIDLGMNAQRLGLWEAPIDWQDVFANPRKFLEQTLYAKEEAVLDQEYILTDDVKDRFPLQQDLFAFSIRDHYLERVRQGERPSKTLEFSVGNHVQLIRANSASFAEAIQLQQALQNEIQWRLKQYTSCIAKSTENFFRWLLQDYNNKLRRALNQAYTTPPPDPFGMEAETMEPEASKGTQTPPQEPPSDPAPSNPTLEHAPWKARHEKDRPI
jgi:superfamily II DNA or RNA helicase